MNRLGIISVCSAAIVVGTLLSLYPSADAKLRALPLPRELKDCYLRAQNYSAQNFVGGLYCWYCESPVRAYIKGSPTPMAPPQYSYYRHLYEKIDPHLHAHGRRKRQATQRCVRKEYRMMTDDERTRFHNAVNTLKRDTTVEPNKYDALALFHTGVATFVAHGGPGFPGWHRVYLLLFEAALQEVDPTVCLPYWDSSLDSALVNPAESYVWSEQFFGDGNGDVTIGPLAGWQTPEGLPLRRAVGRDGMLFTRETMELILTRSSPEELFMPDQDPQYSLEFYHGGGHVFVGGDMERLDTASFDIVFFLHHAFVDYIWELFREKMRNQGLDPQRYPVGEISDYHLPTAPMGFGNITQEEGYLDALMDSYEYQPAPECSQRNPDCGSKYLWCNTTVSRCIPIDPANPPFPVPGPGPNPGPKPKPCKHPKPQAYQNSFCVDGVCDVNRWVWIPVQIMAQRPPEFKDYPSYPVQKGRIRHTNDIYEPSAYSDTSRYIKKKNPKAYEDCEVSDGVGRIYVSSMGVNYDGTYKESAIIDQRLAASISVTYIAVKDPGPKGRSEVILRAHDTCGRICHTACKVPFSNPPRYEACSGVVEVTSDFPRQYGQTYSRATLDVFDYVGNSNCPSFKMDDFFVTFYCDYMDHLPWVDKPTNPILPARPPVQRPSVHHPPGKCYLSTQCTIDTACQGTEHNRQCYNYMEAHVCLGNCRRYAVCLYGVYWPRLCPEGHRYDEIRGKCVRGACVGSAHGHDHGHTAVGVGHDHGHGTAGSVNTNPGFFLGGRRPSSTGMPRPTLDSNTNRYYSRLMGRFGSFMNARGR